MLTTCSAPKTIHRYDCSESGRNELFEKRIAPLLAEDRPKSCTECHLTGIDVSLFMRETPCQSMACLVDLELVDLDAPEQSTILSWIGRASPASTGITSQVIAEEREGFQQWIEQTAQCGTCYDGVAPCGTVTTSVKDCAVNELSPESFSTDDPGDCSDKTLETLFLNRFFPYRRRCFPCHFDGETAHAEAPRFVATGPCEIASLTTYRRLIDLGAFNTSAPEKSRLLLKPLDEALGGIEHGGDSKIHSKDEATYTSFLYFLERYAECANMKP